MPSISESDILDQMLLPLADIFEAGNTKMYDVRPSCSEEYEPLRECLAGLIAEGSLSDFDGTKSYRLTPNGYTKYKDRIRALRTLPR
jgi:hypothetical protein